MTSKQFAGRMGVSQPRASEIEKNELVGSLTLDTLQRAAQALDCRLVYALVPGKPLQEIIEERARRLAIARLKAISHSMSLENQSVDEEDAKKQLDQLIRTLAEREGSALWEAE